MEEGKDECGPPPKAEEREDGEEEEGWEAVGCDGRGILETPAPSMVSDRDDRSL